MGRPRTPTNVLDARGAFARHPERKRARAAEPEPASELGEPPEHFTAEQSACWREFARLAHRDVMADADRIAVEMAAVLLADFRADPSGFSSAKYQRLQSLLATFGMTPADRSRVGATKQQPKANPFAALLKGKK